MFYMKSYMKITVCNVALLKINLFVKFLETVIVI